MVITADTKIQETLETLEVGDEVTVSNIYGNRVNQEVTRTSETEVEIGPPDSPKHRILNTESLVMKKLTTDPMNPISTGTKIEALWVWA